MALCDDPALTYLNGLGYNVVRLPRTGIDPLDVLGRDGKSFERLGRLDQIWRSTRPAPSPGPPATSASVEGQKTAELKLSVGLKILASALGAMGALVPEVGFAYSRAAKVQFVFTDVQVVGIDPILVGDFLSAGDLATSNPFVARYFDEDGTEAYVITEILTSRSITVAATDDNGQSVSLDVPAIASAVGAKVAVTTAGQDSRQVKYAGQISVTFGFKTFGIAHVDGTWRVHGVKPSAGMAYQLPAAATLGADRAATGVATIAVGRPADPIVFGGGVRLGR